MRRIHEQRGRGRKICRRFLESQWLADYEEIQGATGVSYTVTDDVVGKKLRVMVTFTDDAGHEEVLRSRATLKVKAAAEQQKDR